MRTIFFYYVTLLLLFTLTSCKKDDANPVAVDLSIPSLIYPADSAIAITLPPTLKWSGDGAKSYTVEVSVDTTFTTTVYNQSGITTSTQIVNNLSPLTKYYWRVCGVNDKETSRWSNIRSFSTADNPPLSPTLSFPQNSADYYGTTCQLAWQLISGPASLNYRLQISTDNQFTNLYMDRSDIVTPELEVHGIPGGTTYYWRVSALNSGGASSWSDTWSFKIIEFTCGTSTVQYSGIAYNTIQIGNQCWFKENLNCGTMMSASLAQSNNSVIEKYCYDNNESNCSKYGGLYQWNEAMQYATSEGAKGICPSGWHLPTSAELVVLAASVQDDGNSLKASGQGAGDGLGTNASGFSALLSGYSYTNGTAYGLGSFGYFLSSTNSPIGIVLDSGTKNINTINSNLKDMGFSVRCIKD